MFTLGPSLSEWWGNRFKVILGWVQVHRRKVDTKSSILLSHNISQMVKPGCPQTEALGCMVHSNDKGFCGHGCFELNWERKNLQRWLTTMQSIGMCFCACHVYEREHRLSDISAEESTWQQGAYVYSSVCVCARVWVEFTYSTTLTHTCAQKRFFSCASLRRQIRHWGFVHTEELAAS